MAQISRAKRLQEAVAKIQQGLDEIQSLYDEIESWRSNMDGTNLESTQKYQDLEECEGYLDDAIGDIENAVSTLDDVMFPGMFG